MQSQYWLVSAIIASLLALLVGAGCSLLFNSPEEEIEEVKDDEGGLPNAYTCRCTCLAGTKQEFSRDFSACVPDEFNPNLGGAEAATGDLANDCSERVKETFLAILDKCASKKIRDRLAEFEMERGEEPCSCEPFPEQHFVETCNDGCDTVQLAADCSNQDVASSVPGLDEPVCLAEPSSFSPRPIGAALFGRRSTCEVGGTITIERDGDDQTRTAQGVVEFSGGPCPGESCDVGLSYRIDDTETFSFTFLGTGARIRDIRASGATIEKTTVDESGKGIFPPGAARNSGRGSRVDLFLGIETDRVQRSYVGSNADQVDVSVLWDHHPQPRCELNGSILGLEIEEEGTAVTVDFTGDIVNQPPTANAGPDQVVECTSPDGAEITLDGSGSTDPENNIVFTAWRRGGPSGEEIGSDFVAASILQALGTPEEYFFNVVDAFVQVDQDSTAVSVVDTTPPLIACNAPATITPPDAGNHLSFTATAEDTCDNSLAAPTIVNFDCFTFTNKGKRIDKTNSCVVAVDGDTITIVDSGGVGNHITWHVHVSDSSGNRTEVECGVAVVRP